LVRVISWLNQKALALEEETLLGRKAPSH